MLRLFRRKSVDIPVRTFSGWLKCHKPSPDDPISSFLLAHAFPTFVGSDEPPAPSTLHRAAADASRELGFNFLDTSSDKPRRRFAGDLGGLQTLDRGRYYTVCKDANGSDGGTLANELNSYTRPDITGFAYCIPNESSSHISFYASDAPNRASSVVAKAKELEQLSQKAWNLSATLSCNVANVTIEGVLDLRYEDARDWLFQEFGNGCNQWLDYRGGKIPRHEGFWRLFPTVMDWRAGGNEFTDLLGCYCISKGISALIFPSARSNVQVQFESGRLIDFEGWNLVDWRQAPAVVKRELVWLTNWNPPLEGGVRVVAAPHDSKYRGSFRVEFNEQHHMWILHLLFLLGILRQNDDTGLQFAYRWHSGRMWRSGRNCYEAECISCGDKTVFEGVLHVMPHACPVCGFKDIEVPRPTLP
jgi:hypothetical protein